jgi:hypothetical protein
VAWTASRPALPGADRTSGGLHVHLAYRGLFPPEVLAQLGWPPWLLDGRRQQVEFYHRVSSSRQGWRSPTRSRSSARPADKISPERGAGLDGLLRERRRRGGIQTASIRDLGSVQ